MSSIGEDLKGKCVVVTGATGGIGKSVCLAFAELGAHVLAVDLREEPLTELLKTLPGSGHSTYSLDLMQLSEHKKLFEKAQSMGGNHP